MPGNRWPRPGIRVGVPGDPRDMAKAGLPESQSPEGASKRPPERCLHQVPAPPGANTWTGATWFVEGDISDCFGSLDHEILLGILAEKIHDQRFLRLIRKMLKAGYLEDWEYHDTLSGVPQGGVVPPVLRNIYLHKRDEFAERELIPQYTRGSSRGRNPDYIRLKSRRLGATRRGDRASARELLMQMRALPSNDPMDPGYRRLRYLRYADDHILGFTGPKAEAEEIKARLA